MSGGQNIAEMFVVQQKVFGTLKSGTHIWHGTEGKVDVWSVNGSDRMCGVSVVPHVLVVSGSAQGMGQHIWKELLLLSSAKRRSQTIQEAERYITGVSPKELPVVAPPFFWCQITLLVNMTFVGVKGWLLVNRMPLLYRCYLRHRRLAPLQPTTPDPLHAR